MEYLQTADLDPAYVPLVIASSLSLLNGIDMLFALNPEWGEKQEQAIGVVQAFLDGAKFVFSLQPDSRELKAIIEQADEKSEILSKVIVTSSDTHLCGPACGHAFAA